MPSLISADALEQEEDEAVRVTRRRNDLLVHRRRAPVMLLDPIEQLAEGSNGRLDLFIGDVRNRTTENRRLKIGVRATTVAPGPDGVHTPPWSLRAE